MATRNFYRSLSQSALLLGLSSCSVYSPMLPAAPQLRDKGQAEVQLSSFLNGRWEAGATYSPVKYVLLRAAGGWREDKGDTTYARSRQYDVGVGGYWPITPRWLLTGLAGYGEARSSLAEERPDYFSPRITLDVYQARYHKAYGELGVSYQAEPWVTLGVAYRLSQVTFESLTRNEESLPVRTILRHEPLLYARVGNEEGVLRWMQFQLGMGATWTPGYYKRQWSDSYAVRQVKAGNPFFMLGVVLYPHRFKRVD